MLHRCQFKKLNRMISIKESTKTVKSEEGSEKSISSPVLSNRQLNRFKDLPPDFVAKTKTGEPDGITVSDMNNALKFMNINVKTTCSDDFSLKKEIDDLNPKSSSDLVALNELTPSVLLKLHSKGAIKLSDEQIDLLNEIVGSGTDIGKTKQLEERALSKLPKWVYDELNNYGINQDHINSVAEALKGITVHHDGQGAKSAEDIPPKELMQLSKQGKIKLPLHAFNVIDNVVKTLEEASSKPKLAKTSTFKNLVSDTDSESSKTEEQSPSLTITVEKVKAVTTSDFYPMVEALSFLDGKGEHVVKI